MKKLTTVLLLLGMVILGFPLNEVFVWSCALIGAFIFSNFITTLIWKIFVKKIQDEPGKAI